jgi:hypothetical protein
MSKNQIDEMAEEYDFSKGERGKFYSAGAALSPPVHLEPEVLKFLQATAKARGTTLDALVNQLLKKDIELMESAG